MFLNFFRFHWLRFIAAILALLLSLIYLLGFEEISLAGFGIGIVIAGYITIKIRKGTMPARCDLCGSAGSLKAEYGTGFANARLVLSCSSCGRVINGGEKGTIKPRRE